VHPQVPPIIDQDHFTSRYEMFPMGHNRIIQLGRPSLRDRLPDGVPHPFDDLLRRWDIDPDQYPDFETKAMQGWRDLKAAKRRLWTKKGYLHYEHLTDEDLTDYDNGAGVLDYADQVVVQDMLLTAGQTAGWRSRGYQEPYMASQETRVRRFHEVLHDYLAGHPPGR
jgi:hypothetical protein